MIKYYKQKFKTDCLLAAAENFTQQPRNHFGKLEWREHNGDKYLKYHSFAKALCKWGGAQIVFQGTVHLNDKPAILGSVAKLSGHYICHALFWDGRHAYCPQRDSFVDLNELDISYVILHPHYNHPLAYKNIKHVCHDWDRYISEYKNEDTKEPERKELITLFYNGRAYPGDLVRANTNREYPK